MANYILFDKLVEDGSSFIRSAKELFDKLGFSVVCENNFKKDGGLETKALNEIKFHTNNAYNLSLANQGGFDIICVEDSSFLSLNLSKKALLEDENLKAKVEKELETPLNLHANIYHINDILREKIGFAKIQSKLKSSFEDFNVAPFYGTKSARLEDFTDLDIQESLLLLIGANTIKIPTCKNSDGYEILPINATIADKLAGVVLLDAFDNAADFMLISDVTTFKMFDARQKNIAKLAGRDIDLPLVNISQLLLLALGVKDKDKLALDAHKVKVTLL